MRIWAEIDQICIESLLSKTAVSQNTLSAILNLKFVLIKNQVINYCWQSNLKLGCTPVCSYKK